jgi:hypothetical protein
MESKERYIFEALMALPNFKTFEFKNQNETITLIGSKRGLFHPVRLQLQTLQLQIFFINIKVA